MLLQNKHIGVLVEDLYEDLYGTRSCGFAKQGPR